MRVFISHKVPGFPTRVPGHLVNRTENHCIFALQVNSVLTSRASMGESDLSLPQPCYCGLPCRKVRRIILHGELARHDPGLRKQMHELVLPVCHLILIITIRKHHDFARAPLIEHSLGFAPNFPADRQQSRLARAVLGSEPQCVQALPACMWGGDARLALDGVFIDAVAELSWEFEEWRILCYFVVTGDIVRLTAWVRRSTCSGEPMCSSWWRFGGKILRLVRKNGPWCVWWRKMSWKYRDVRACFHEACKGSSVIAACMCMGNYK